MTFTELPGGTAIRREPEPVKAHQPDWREALELGATVLLSVILIFAALALRTGGFL